MAQKYSHTHQQSEVHDGISSIKHIILVTFGFNIKIAVHSLGGGGGLP